jgi:hypothetical protein
VAQALGDRNNRFSSREQDAGEVMAQVVRRRPLGNLAFFTAVPNSSVPHR